MEQGGAMTLARRLERMLGIQTSEDGLLNRTVKISAHIEYPLFIEKIL